MNAAVTVTRAEKVTGAHALFHLAGELPRPQHADVEAGIIALGDALEILGALDSGAMEWDWVWPELDGEDEALKQAADEVIAAADALYKMIGGHCAAELEASS